MEQEKPSRQDDINLVAAVAARCLNTVLMDEAWQDFGFAKRPRVGTLFQRFRPKWKFDLEKAVIQEMLPSLSAVHVLAEKMSTRELRTLVEFYTANEDVTGAMGYSSPAEAARHLLQRIAQYGKTPVGEWHNLMAQRIDPLSIPEIKLAGKVMVGCVQFSQNLGNMMLILRDSRSD